MEDLVFGENKQPGFWAQISTTTLGVAHTLKAHIAISARRPREACPFSVRLRTTLQTPTQEARAVDRRR